MHLDLNETALDRRNKLYGVVDVPSICSRTSGPRTRAARPRSRRHFTLGNAIV